MFGKYNGFVSKARVSACMYFLVPLIINACRHGFKFWDTFVRPRTKLYDWGIMNTAEKRLRMHQIMKIWRGI
jgi:hypothetical protein